jgi:hypothetical protein
MYRTSARKAVVAPSHLGVNSPEFEATPEYYVRGRYPAWFRLEDDIVPIEASSALIVGRPTLDPDFTSLGSKHSEQLFDFDALRDDGATLWVAMSTRS